jgi:hypothetical protein
MNGKLEFHPAMSVKSNPDFIHLTATGEFSKLSTAFAEVPVPVVAPPSPGISV